MNDTTVTVSIGRSLPRGGELSGREWGRFKDRATSIVLLGAESFRAIHFTGEGQGWFEGRAETSFTIIATVDESLVDELKARLSIVAHVYGQQSIAVTTGQTTIVEAAKERRG